MNQCHLDMGVVHGAVPHIEAAVVLALDEMVESVTYLDALSAKAYTVMRSSGSPGWYSAMTVEERKRAFQFNLENGYDSRDYAQ